MKVHAWSQYQTLTCASVSVHVSALEKGYSAGSHVESGSESNHLWEGGGRWNLCK